MHELSLKPRGHSYYEANARARIAGLLDKDTFQEILGPGARLTSPHLEILQLPSAFDDGIIIGRGLLNGRPVLIASQEGGFMGGAVGEVHGAKMTGLLELSIIEKPAAVLLLLESGGVRLHEANAGLIAISEIIRALLAAREAGVPVVGLIGGVFGCFGGMGIVARCCDSLIINEEGRMGLSGPEVIESTMGVEEFDASDRALVWRTFGGKHRFLLGEVQSLVDDDIAEFRQAVIHVIDQPADKITLESMEHQHEFLKKRLADYGLCQESCEIWQRMGLNDADQLPLLNIDDFLNVTRELNRGQS